MIISFIEWSHALILNYPTFQYLIIFIGAVLGGELALFILGFLTAQGFLPLFPVIILGFLGAFTLNILWFLLGKTTILERMISHRYTNTTTSIVAQAVSRISKGNHFLAFTIIKFLVGTPILLIIYTSKIVLSLKKFIYYESVAIFLSLLVFIPLGFVSGLGFTYLTEVSHNLRVAIGFILIMVLIIVIIQIRLEKIFTNKI